MTPYESHIAMQENAVKSFLASQGRGHAIDILDAKPFLVNVEGTLATLAEKGEIKVVDHGRYAMGNMATKPVYALATA